LAKVLNALGCHERELSVLFTDDARISELNRDYLHRKGPTNVIAFPMAEGLGTPVESVLLGDVVISVETALKEGGEIGEGLDRTIDRLLIHGVLHLLGYDHEISPAEEERMQREEKRMLEIMGEE
jgi:probable rRNA maturation factor